MVERVAKSAPKSPAPATARTRRVAPFGPPPLIQGEDRGAYDKLLARVSAAVKPVDILEEIWVHDIVDLEWEAALAASQGGSDDFQRVQGSPDGLGSV